MALEYTLHGVRLAVEIPDEAVRQIIADFLESSPGQWGMNNPPHLTWRLRLEPGPLPPLPDWSQLFFHYCGLHGFYAEDDSILFACEYGRLVWRPGEAHIEGIFTPAILETPAFLAHSVFGIILCEAVRAFGLYFLHTGACVSPEGTGYLFPAQGESGKTTLTLTLLRAGWSGITDDAVFLTRTADSQISAVPYRLDFHLPGREWSTDPALGHLAGRQEFGRHKDKRPIAGGELFPDRIIPRMAQPSVLVFPTIVDAPVSRVEALSSADAFRYLIPQSLYVMFPQHRRVSEAHLGVLRDLLAGAKTYRFLGGRDVLEDPASVVDLLASLSHDAGLGQRL